VTPQYCQTVGDYASVCIMWRTFLHEVLVHVQCRSHARVSVRLRSISSLIYLYRCCHRELLVRVFVCFDSRVKFLCHLLTFTDVAIYHSIFTNLIAAKMHNVERCLFRRRSLFRVINLSLIMQQLKSTFLVHKVWRCLLTCYKSTEIGHFVPL